MMYYIMSSLNYNTLMATHNICCESHYKERLYGTKRFYKLKSDKIENRIRLFKDIPENPENLLIKSDLEQYIVIVDVEGIEVIEIDGEYYCKDIIYLDMVQHNIMFLNKQEERIVTVKSKLVSEVKQPIISLPLQECKSLKFDVVRADACRNALKGICLMNQYINKVYGVDADFEDSYFKFKNLSATDNILVNHYIIKILEFKCQWKNELTKDNLGELKRFLGKDNHYNRFNMVLDVLNTRDYDKIATIDGIVDKALYYFLLKINNFEELRKMNIKEEVMCISMIFYGAYTGFASLDRLIYSVATYDEEKHKICSWFDWIKENGLK